MNIRDFNYELPQGLIAQAPLEQRDLARLMVVDRTTGAIEHALFRDLPSYLRPHDVMVVNDTRVNEASFSCRKDGTGASIDVLLTKRCSPTRFQALVKPLKRLHVGETCTVTSDVSMRLLERNDDGGAMLEFSHDPYAHDKFRALARVQIPPYIKQFPDDPGAYQTVYAREPGSVAAPTAGLHFTPELLARIRDLGIDIQHVTLDVGLATFQPVRAEFVAEHKMLEEWYSISPAVAHDINVAKTEGRPVTAVGTTVVRTLESAWHDGNVHPGRHATSLFIYPGFEFHVVDRLLTNFHLPKSTLLMLVSAFAGHDLIMRDYKEAVHERYRFFSYGDCMLIV